MAWIAWPRDSIGESFPSSEPGNERLLTPALSSGGGEGEDSDAFAGFMPRTLAQHLLRIAGVAWQRCEMKDAIERATL